MRVRRHEGMTGRATDYTVLIFLYSICYIFYRLVFFNDMYYVFHMLLFYNMLFNMFISLDVCRVIDYFRDTMETFFFNYFF